MMHPVTTLISYFKAFLSVMGEDYMFILINFKYDKYNYIYSRMQHKFQLLK